MNKRRKHRAPTAPAVQWVEIIAYDGATKYCSECERPFTDGEAALVTEVPPRPGRPFSFVMRRHAECPAERLREPSAIERFLADDRALETVEVAVAAGIVVAGLVLVILAIGAFVRGSLGELLRGAKGATP